MTKQGVTIKIQTPALKFENGARYILVVDDDSHHRRLLAILLERRLGAEVLLAENIDDAKDQLTVAPIGLVISDYHLGSELGTELLEFIRGSTRAIPFLLMSASHDAGEVAREHGVPFIAKPVHDILTQIRACLPPHVITEPGEP